MGTIPLNAAMAEIRTPRIAQDRRSRVGSTRGTFGFRWSRVPGFGPLGDDGFVAHGTYSIPQAYWKVVVALNDAGDLVQRAFWLENPAPDVAFRPERSPGTYAIEISTLPSRTGLEFPAAILDAPVLDD